MGRAVGLGLVVVLAGCGGDADPVDTAPESDTALTSQIVDAPVGHCAYINAFSNTEECKEYRGDGWTAADAEADCAAPTFPAQPGAFTADAPCDYPAILGTCTVSEGDPDETVLVFPGDDPEQCGGVEIGCSFAAGTFVGAGVCDGETGGGGDGGGQPFVPFEQVCEADDGMPEGEVCTWNAISGCTEPGLNYLEYGDCDAVLTQRPYIPYGPAGTSSPDDARLDDPAWMAEFGWFTNEVEACACTCCHSETAPDGPAGFYVEAGPIWLDTASDEAVAMFAGWIDSGAFGAFPPEENQGFDRSTTGLPTTDVPRMVAFLEDELARRGKTRADYADEPPWGGPLVDQLEYRPGPCGEGQGIDADGVLVWTGGDARYLYVLEAEATSPTVPPNLDLPEGTLWRADVGPDDAPMPSGVRYGEVPAGARQAWPETGAPVPLTSGGTYYLVALADIILPATRCLFTAP